MKNLLYLFIAISTSFLIGCSDDDSSNSVAAPTNWARFIDGTSDYEVSETSTSVIDIPVTINYNSASPVTVSYTITGNSDAYELLEGGASSVEIPAGGRVGYIKVRPIDNEDYNDPQNTMTIKLTGVSGDGVLATESDAGYLEKTIVFKDNECQPGERDTWIGSLSVEDVGYATYGGSGEITSDNCDALIITSDLPNDGTVASFEFILDGQGGITCAKQPYASTGLTYEASGTYDVATSTITVDYVYRRADGSVRWPGTNIIKTN